MTPLRKKQAAGAAAAALLLLGSAYAWRNANQHKTNELRDNLNGNNDVTLVENFIPITDWLEGQEINKDISVKNNTSVETGNNAYVRIQLKEFLEFTNKQEDLSTVRYAVTTAGDFAKFETQADAQTYADANNLTGNPVQVVTTAFEGDDYWFIPTNAEATHGQYGKFLVLKVGDGTSKSIIDETVKNASADASSKHQAITHGEDLYTTQTFGATGTDINAKRAYDSGKLVTDYPTGGGIEAGKDLKDYITWNFGSDVTTLDVFDPESETAQWVIDTETGWVYWSQALAPGEITSNFLDSLKLDNAPKDVSLYYAIHTNLEAVDYNEIDTMALPQGIEDAWKKKQRFTVTFVSNGGSEVTGFKVVADELITEPAAPTKADVEDVKFGGWYAKEDLTGKAWNFATDKMPAKNLTLYAKWNEEEAIARVYFKDFTGATEVLPAKKITASDKDLEIPAGPAKTGEYFLGWAESASQAPSSPGGTAVPTSMLYTPSSTTGVAVLNAPDQGYLGYKEKTTHKLENIEADRTLYAVYYRALKGTNAQGQDFIWNDAIWRVLNTTASSSSLRLVIKFSALMEDEVTAVMPSFGLENGTGIDFPEVTVEDALRVHFHSQDGPVDTDDEMYFFNSSSDDGYGRSRLKSVIDAYYNHLADKTAVEAVTLNNPNWAQFTGTGYLGTRVSYSNWEWSKDSEDNNKSRAYRDARFETTLGGTKQAFALSYGDIHGAIGVPTTPGNTIVELLRFNGSSNDRFWLRSTGSVTKNVGTISNGMISAFGLTQSSYFVRPSLYLTVD